jgi:hypothetical protein
MSIIDETDRKRDKEPRRRMNMAHALKAASQAGFARVRMTVDSDGKITLDMGAAGDLPPDTKGEQDQWDKRVAEVVAKEKSRRGE